MKNEPKLTKRQAENVWRAWRWIEPLGYAEVAELGRRLHAQSKHLALQLAQSIQEAESAALAEEVAE